MGVPGRQNVVHLVNSLEIGGIETHLARLLPLLSGRFHQSVVTLRGGGPIAAQLEKSGCPVLRHRVRGKGWWADVHDLAQVLHTLRPAIVHAHSRYPATLGLTAAFAAGIPRRIAHYYSLMSKKDWSPKASLRERRLLARGCTLLFCSEDVRDDFLRVVPEAGRLPHRIVPIGIDVAQFQPEAPAARAARRASLGIGADVGLIGIVARLAPVKNHPLLLRAARMLKERDVKFRLWIMGPGSDEAQANLQRRIAEEGLSGHAEYRGFCPDLPAALNLLDAFVLCSRNEGMPVSVLEAWACGVPVVATRVPGLRRFVRHEVDGLLCEADDAPSLAEALQRVLTDEALRATIRENARRRAEEFSLEATASGAAALYEELLKQPLHDSILTRQACRMRGAWASWRSRTPNHETS